MEEDKKTIEPAQETPSTPNPSASEKPAPKSKWPLIVIGLLILLLIPLGGYFVYTQVGVGNDSESPTPTISQTEDNTPTPEPEESSLGEFDKTYTSSEHGWQTDYPSALTVSKYGPEQIGEEGVGEVVVFSYLGPTQKEGTEFYDGISMTIGVKEKAEEQTLQDFADNDSDIDPEIGSKTPMKAITINGLSGYETKVSGLGTVRAIYLQHPENENQVYYISIFAEGPGESKAEYEDTVEKMLEGFRNIQ